MSIRIIRWQQSRKRCRDKGSYDGDVRRAGFLTGDKNHILFAVKACPNVQMIKNEQNDKE